MAEQNSYRWYILAASFLILVIDGGVRFSFGVLIKPLVTNRKSVSDTSSTPPPVQVVWFE